MRRSNLCLSESATSILLFLLLRVLSWSESELLDEELEEYRLLNNNWIILTVSVQYSECLSLTFCASL